MNSNPFKMLNAETTMISETPDTPYYAVIFTSLRREGDHGYAATSAKMMELAEKQPGFLGVEHVRETLGITVSYWKDLDSIRKWKTQADHTLARQKGRTEWYKAFKVRIARVESDYGFNI
jgi:heme-degrading monooxygenase HmoA